MPKRVPVQKLLRVFLRRIFVGICIKSLSASMFTSYLCHTCICIYIYAYVMSLSA